jgi:CrcB protein
MELSITSLAAVALGGAIGAPLRFVVSGLIGRRFGETFPWGTMVVNVSGALTIGVIAASVDRLDPAWLFIVTGVLGSYTTVSSFSLQTLALAREGSLARAGLNVALSTFLCLAGVAAGYAFGRLLFHG